MTVAYDFTVEGAAQDGQTWTTSGVVQVANEGEFLQAVHLAMRDSFNLLTGGAAVYGKPGEGCRGPYQLTRLEVKRVTH